MRDIFNVEVIAPQHPVPALNRLSSQKGANHRSNQAFGIFMRAVCEKDPRPRQLQAHVPAILLQQQAESGFACSVRSRGSNWSAFFIAFFPPIPIVLGAGSGHHDSAPAVLREGSSQIHRSFNPRQRFFPKAGVVGFRHCPTSMQKVSCPHPLDDVSDRSTIQEIGLVLKQSRRWVEARIP